MDTEIEALLVVAARERQAYRQAMLDRRWMNVLLGIRQQIQTAQAQLALVPHSQAFQAQLQRWIALEHQFLNGGSNETN